MKQRISIIKQYFENNVLLATPYNLLAKYDRNSYLTSTAKKSLKKFRKLDQSVVSNTLIIPQKTAQVKKTEAETSIRHRHQDLDTSAYFTKVLHLNSYKV